MRLSSKEINIIRNVILEFDPKSEILLYGSRLHDDLKGGDIDLLVLSDNLKFSDKISILTNLKLKLGDQKIDLTITKKEKVKEDPFISNIIKSAQTLK